MRQNCLIYLELSWYHSSEWLLANPKNSNSNSDSHTQLVLHPGNWAAHPALARLRTLRHLGHRFLEWWNRRRDWKPSPVRLVVVAARYHLDPFKVPWFTMVYHNILSKFEIHIDPYWSILIRISIATRTCRCSAAAAPLQPFALPHAARPSSLSPPSEKWFGVRRTSLDAQQVFYTWFTSKSPISMCISLGKSH